MDDGIGGNRGLYLLIFKSIGSGSNPEEERGLSPYSQSMSFKDRLRMLAPGLPRQAHIHPFPFQVCNALYARPTQCDETVGLG